MENQSSTYNMGNLPYISLDEEYSLNVAMFIVVVANLSRNAKDTLVLDINKLQIFLYLVKNPVRAIRILELTGKKHKGIARQHIFTIKSMSSNVDILYDNNRVKFLIRELTSCGILLAEKKAGDTAKVYLSDKGTQLSQELNGDYLDAIKELVVALSPLKSLPTTKLNSLLNQVFRE